MRLTLREVRLLPIVLFATASLLALKTVGLLTSGGYVLGTLHRAQAQDAAPQIPFHSDGDVAAAPKASPSSAPKRSWAQEILDYPDITGSVPSKPAPADLAKKAAEQAPPTGTGAKAEPKPALVDGGQPSVPAGERAVLERLQERRQELEARARELEIREGLLKAAEKRIEGRLGELKEQEGLVNGAVEKKDEAEAARFKNLVSMYENMKAKEAARIFDRLDIRILLDVSTQINPRKMSDILAQMSPEAAERLTVELATRASGRPQSTADLPKIEGRPRL
jgi:flagellar motility protein MotE (MotC chaperone)